MKKTMDKIVTSMKNFWQKLTLPSKIVFILWTLSAFNGLFLDKSGLNFLQRLIVALTGYLIVVGFVQLISTRKKKIVHTRNPRSLAPTDDLPVEIAPNIILSEGEICHYCGPATHIKQKNVVVGYSGGSRGTSVRLAKGVSVRVGASKASPVRGEVQDKADGILSITNKRIIFSGVKKSFDNKISSLSAVTPGQDGIVLQFGSTHYPLATHESLYIYQILSRLVNFSSADV